MNEAQLKKLYQKKDKYILDENRNPIPATLLEWGEYLETHYKERIVNQSNIDNKWISTVFLGLDHNWSIEPGHEPYIFETMVFEGQGKRRKEMYCDRYATWKDAEEGHEKAIQWVKDGCIDDK